MKKALFITLAMAILTFGLSAASAKGDPVSGKWAGVFSVAGQSANVTLTLAEEHGKVAGTISSEHTGPGTITDGTWKGGKLSATLVFEKHESIRITGELQKGQLVGEFATEGMTGTWIATKTK